MTKKGSIFLDTAFRRIANVALLATPSTMAYSFLATGWAHERFSGRTQTGFAYRLAVSGHADRQPVFPADAAALVAFMAPETPAAETAPPSFCLYAGKNLLHCPTLIAGLRFTVILGAGAADSTAIDQAPSLAHWLAATHAGAVEGTADLAERFPLVIEHARLLSALATRGVGNPLAAGVAQGLPVPDETRLGHRTAAFIATGMSRGRHVGTLFHFFGGTEKGRTLGPPASSGSTASEAGRAGLRLRVGVAAGAGLGATSSPP